MTFYQLYVDFSSFNCLCVCVCVFRLCSVLTESGHFGYFGPNEANVATADHITKQVRDDQVGNPVAPQVISVLLKDHLSKFTPGLFKSNSATILPRILEYENGNENDQDARKWLSEPLNREIERNLRHKGLIG